MILWSDSKDTYLTTLNRWLNIIRFCNIQGSFQVIFETSSKLNGYVLFGDKVI